MRLAQSYFTGYPIKIQGNKKQIYKKNRRHKTTKEVIKAFLKPYLHL